MEYFEIITEILNVYNINASEFADKIGVQRSSISHILSGRNKPSLDFLIKVKEEYKELRWDYLLLGIKPMIENEPRNGEKPNSNIDIDNKLPHPPNVVNDEEQAKYYTRNNKEVTKIVWFYSDHTFEIFKNSKT